MISIVWSGQLRPLMVLAAALVAAASLLPTEAQAQCRQGSGPDHGDGIPYCSSLPPAPSQNPPSHPKEWHDSAAALAWGDGPKGDDYVGVELYLDEQMAREAALSKCQAKGLANCQVATSITNGVIAIGIDANGQLRARTGWTKAEAKQGLLEKCARDGVKCKVLKLFNGQALYY